MGDRDRQPAHPAPAGDTFAHRWLPGGGYQRDLMVLAGWRSDDMLSRYAIEGLAAARSSRAVSGEAAKRLPLQLADLGVSVDTEHQICLREDTPEHMLDPGPVRPYGSQSTE